MSAPPPLPSIDSLIGQDYKTSAFSEGLTSEDYRGQHRIHGEQVRWWKGYENATGARGPNGEVPAKGGILRIEQPLDEEVRVRIYEAKKTIVSAEFGVFEAGTAMISCLAPVEPAKGDVFLRVSRTILTRCTLEPSGQTRDKLPHGFVASIENVFTAQGALTPDEYRACDEGIEWLEDIPVGLVFIEYRFHPLFEFQGTTDEAPPMGRDGQPLPQVGALRLVKSGEINLV